MNQTIHINEQELRSIIKECVKTVLNEGYSSKSHKEEIVDIAKQIYQAIILNGESSFSTKYLIPYAEHAWYSYVVNASISKSEDAYANRHGVNVMITPNTELNTIVKLLMHEFTHIYDELINKETGFKDGDLYSGIDNSYDVPKSILDIIYHLWIPTEFSAFQTTYDFKDENFNAMVERFMRYIREAYELPTTNESAWRGIKNILFNHIPNRYKRCTVEAFKKYFVNQSLVLMKKLIKKWNGEQNTQFV